MTKTEWLFNFFNESDVSELLNNITTTDMLTNYDNITKLTYRAANVPTNDLPADFDTTARIAAVYSVIRKSIPDILRYFKAIPRYFYARDDSITDFCPTASDHIDYISESAFYECTNLKKVDLRQCDRLRTISRCAFVDCDSLTEVYLPADLLSVEDFAFSLCEKLHEVYFEGTQSTWSVITKGSSWNAYNHKVIVHCSDGDLEADSL